uniref:thiosulfate sulfurtransferase/rhodanese-like domain-containing protein 3 n=1 Tax=Panthera onca TaxID=9690 RepID=UPI0029552465|nr:thiosulfate sulfurtransferase/rhodanese-like domain-containing protein 3 [Panthera onca]
MGLHNCPSCHKRLEARKRRPRYCGNPSAAVRTHHAGPRRRVYNFKRLRLRSRPPRRSRRRKWSGARWARAGDGAAGAAARECTPCDPRVGAVCALGFRATWVWGRSWGTQGRTSALLQEACVGRHFGRYWRLSNEGLKSIKGSCHNFCTAVFKDVTYKELKSLLNSRQITLIDVRERWEIVEYGKIPGSVNIPLDEVGEALQMNPKDFKEKYNEVKPSKSDSLVFSCLAGVRSKKAMDTAVSLGFNSVQHYAGGWKEWATYEFSEKKKGN